MYVGREKRGRFHPADHTCGECPNPAELLCSTTELHARAQGALLSGGIREYHSPQTKLRPKMLSVYTVYKFEIYVCGCNISIFHFTLFKKPGCVQGPPESLWLDTICPATGADIPSIMLITSSWAAACNYHSTNKVAGCIQGTFVYIRRQLLAPFVCVQVRSRLS